MGWPDFPLGCKGDEYSGGGQSLSGDWVPLAHADDRYAARRVVRVDTQDVRNLFTVHVEDEKRAGVVRPRAREAKHAAASKCFQGGTMVGASSKPLWCGLEGEFNDDHGRRR